jgi:oligopeptide/dipeptide ABC transporter ATP-binding protein
LFENPKHPYTLGLFRSLPRLDEPRGRLRTIEGRVPAATHFPNGCRFNPRCPYAMDVCRVKVPPLDIGTPEHGVACWLHDEGVMKEQGRPAGIPETEEAAR